MTAWQAKFAVYASLLQPISTRVASLLGREQVQQRLRLGFGVLLALWVVMSLLRGIWALVPPVPPLDAALRPINPALQAPASAAARPVALGEMLEAHLFGEPGAEALPEEATSAPVDLAALSEAQAAEELAGIEDGAPETRLPLTLRGIVAASEAGLGQAIIEHQREQELYRVGDELPAGSAVKLAKVMPMQVVISNAGRYELLRLFTDQGQIAVPVARSTPRAQPRGASAGAAPAAAGDAARSRIAASYREQLYRDPQSLADVVRINAVREDGQLRGYRVNPGRAAEEFTILGFRPGDLVTAVNGLSLQDPSNAVRLYQAMRSASEAEFEIQRGEETVSLSVSLSGAANE